MQRKPSLPNASTRRNTARAMLFVWLFALMSGLVNACPLAPDDMHHHASPSPQHAVEDTARGVIGDHADKHSHDEGDSETGASKESCLKACDEGSQSLLKHGSSFDLVDPGLPPLVAAAWAMQVPISPALDQACDYRLPDRGPPIRVLFSRLAL